MIWLVQFFKSILTFPATTFIDGNKGQRKLSKFEQILMKDASNAKKVRFI